LRHISSPHHRRRHNIGAAQRRQIGGGFVGRRGVEIALARHPRIAAMLAFRGLFHDDHLGPEIMGGDGCGKPRRPEPGDNDIGFDVPPVRQ
jgi:hypothetical protein